MRRAVFVIVVCSVVVLAMCAGASVRACEDAHPPVIASPRQAFRLHNAAGEDVLSLTFDPRGIGQVEPPGDDARVWIDSNDETGVWHYREWQWWNGHPWGESCRPRFYADAKFNTRAQNPRAAIIAYRIDGFDCRQAFLLPEKVDPQSPYLELVTKVRNVSGRQVEEYAQFFACYTPLNRGRSFWYWDESDKLVLFADRGVRHLDGYIAHPQAYFGVREAIPHCPRGGGKIVGRWSRPMMISQASPAGWRSIIMIEPQFAAALAQGIDGGAMDYIVFPAPDTPTFPNGAEFNVHIRHVMLKSPELPSLARLRSLWDEFEGSHTAVHKRAAL